MTVKLPSSKTVSSKRCRAKAGTKLSLLALCFCLATFIAMVVPIAYENTNSSDWDQRDYLKIALWISQGDAFTDGNRNPLYPLILAPFAQRGIQFFSMSKLVSMALGCLGLIVTFFVSRTYIGETGALVVTSLMMLNKEYQRCAAYVDVEVLLTPLFLLAWHHCCRLAHEISDINTNTTRTALVAGVLSALSYLAKGTGLLIPVILVGTLTVRYGSTWLKRKPAWLYAAAFCLVAAPLWIHNSTNYGNPLYNVNTTHYQWNDTWEANYVYTPSELPTASSYVQTHQLSEIWDRLARGLLIAPKQWYAALQLSPNSAPAGTEIGAIIALGGVAMVIAGTLAHGSWRFHSPWSIFTGIGVLGFVILFSWYSPISDSPRFVLPWVPIIYLALVYTAKMTLASRTGSQVGLHYAILAIVFTTCGVLIANNSRSRSYLMDMSNHDRTASQETARVVELLLASTRPGDSLVIGPTHALPAWLAYDREIMSIPSGRQNWTVYQSWLLENQAQFVVINREVWLRRSKLLANHFHWSDEGLITNDGEPLGWRLLEPSTYPCTTCIFSLDHKPFLPTTKLEATFDEAVQLLGYSYTPDSSDRSDPEDDIQITLFWLLKQPMSETTHAFVHLLDSSGELIAQDDGALIQDLQYEPDADFRSGTYFRDTHELAPPPPGTYYIHVGTYRWGTQQRMNITEPENLSQQDHITLAELTIN